MRYGDNPRAYFIRSSNENNISQAYYTCRRDSRASRYFRDQTRGIKREKRSRSGTAGVVHENRVTAQVPFCCHIMAVQQDMAIRLFRCDAAPGMFRLPDKTGSVVNRMTAPARIPAATGAPCVPRSFLSGRCASCDFSARTATARIRARSPMMAEKATRFLCGCFMFLFLVHRRERVISDVFR